MSFYLLQFVVVVKTIFITPAIRLWVICFSKGFLAKRVLFEQNVYSPWCESFGVGDKSADYIFHVSSEGELEQVFPLIETHLHSGKLVELLYTSPSVDRSCRKLAQAYYPNIRILPLPLLATMADIDLNYWVTAKKMVMCRYDFFPELLFLTKQMEESWLVGASVKKYQSKLKKRLSLSRLYWVSIFSFFSKIIPATLEDRELIATMAPVSKLAKVFDFRVLRIFNRLAGAEDLLNSKHLKGMKEFTAKFENSLIVGSGWEGELEAILSDTVLNLVQEKKMALFFAPHRLDDTFFNIFKERVNSCSSSIPIYLLLPSHSTTEIIVILDSYLKNPGIIYSQIPGVLCELYSMFSLALVGGGWGRSVHSVLEPFLANCKVICGKKIYRSTEIDLITGWAVNEVSVLDTPNMLGETIQNYLATPADHNLRFQLHLSYRKEYDLLIKDML